MRSVFVRYWASASAQCELIIRNRIRCQQKNIYRIAILIWCRVVIYWEYPSFANITDIIIGGCQVNHVLEYCHVNFVQQQILISLVEQFASTNQFNHPRFRRSAPFTYHLLPFTFCIFQFPNSLFHLPHSEFRLQRNSLCSLSSAICMLTPDTRNLTPVLRRLLTSACRDIVPLWAGRRRVICPLSSVFFP